MNIRNGFLVPSMLPLTLDDENGGDGNTQQTSSPGGKTFSEDYVKTLRSESAGYRTQVREREATIASLTTERDDARKELDALKATSGSAEALVAAADARTLRYEIALEKGLTLKQAGRLVGTTREELLADADEYLQENGGANTPTPPPSTGPNLPQGNTPKAPSGPSINDALRALAAGGSA